MADRTSFSDAGAVIETSDARTSTTSAGVIMETAPQPAPTGFEPA